MSQAVLTTSIPIDELEASKPMYLEMLRILVREGKSPEQIQRSICWDRLKNMHRMSPAQHPDPNQLYLTFKREICA
jgi:hypothetical protein